jgi:tripartite-type tricarboxylate transporter receptor subunit TctC
MTVGARGQQFVVENRPGAGSNLSIEMATKSQPDGYTLVVISSTNARNASLYKKLNFDLISDIAPVASLYRNAPYVVVVVSRPARGAGRSAGRPSAGDLRSAGQLNRARERR